MTLFFLSVGDLVFAGVNNSWCSEEEETSSPPEDGLTD
jgi:hypothetical protein